MKAANAKIIKEDSKSFTVQREDGKTFTVAKTKDTLPMHKMLSAGGGKVEGKAKVAGDSPVNDTVDAKLSPGEIVIPRSIASDPKKALAFIQEALQGKHPATGSKHYLGGEIEAIAAQQGISPRRPSPDDSPLTKLAMGQIDAMGRPVVDPAAQGTSPYLEGTPMGAAQLANGPLSPGVMPVDQSVTPPMADPLAQGAAEAQAQIDPRNNGQMQTAPTGGVEPAQGAPVVPGGDTPSTGLPGNGMVTQSQTSTTHESATADQKAHMDAYDAKAKELYDTEIEAGQAEQQRKLAQSTAEYNMIQESNAKFAAFEEKKQQEINRRLEDIRSVEDRFKGMSVDGGRFYGDGVTGSKVMAGIGLLLGSLGGPGANEKVGDIIQKAIDRDIEVQKANINKVGKEVDIARGGLKDYLAITHDMETAMAAEKARQLEAVGKQFEAIAAANSNPAIKQKALEHQMPYMQQAATLRNQVGKNVTTTMSMTAPMSADAYKDQRERQVNGVGLALTKEGAAKMRDSQVEYSNAKQGVTDLIQMMDIPFKSVRPTVRAKAEATSRMLQGALRSQILGPGTVNNEERKILENIAANPTAIFQLDASAKASLNTVLDKVENYWQSQIHSQMDPTTLQRPAAQDYTPAGKNIIKGKKPKKAH